MKHYIFFTASLFCVGCSSIKSDLSYQKGKDCFWNGQYHEALAHLHRAIELDPHSASGHRQLALTYERMNNLPLAWEHARIAYSIDKFSQINLDVLARIFRSVAKKNHFDEPRKPEAAIVVDVLGTADKYLHSDRGDLKALYYGPICLHIEQGRLSSTEWLGLVSTR